MSVAASRVRTPVESPLRRFWSQFSESRIALAGLAMLVFVVAAALFAPWLAPQNPYDLASLDLLDSRLAPGERGMSGGSYLLGTDGQGRDMLSAILYGLRVSLYVGVASGALALAIGVLSYAAGSRAVNTVSEHLLRETASRITQAIAHYLEVPPDNMPEAEAPETEAP